MHNIKAQEAWEIGYVTFMNWASFTDCISKINVSQVDNADNIDLVIPSYWLSEYTDSYSKILRKLQQFFRDKVKCDTAASVKLKIKNPARNEDTNVVEMRL